jgi:hypothetical protein
MKNKRRKVWDTKKIFLGGAVVVLGVVVLIFISENNNKSIPHHNLIDAKISQYSDKNITQSAVVANPEFKNIVFETPQSAKSLFSGQIAAVVRAIKSFTKNPSKEMAKEYGIWVWTPTMRMTPEYMDSIISGAKADGVNVVYLSIDTYLDIFTMQKGVERENLRKEFGDKLADFIGRANHEGISVDAEAGWRNWAESDNTYKGFAIVSFVKNFNATHENKFRGFQYDIEPYLLDSYEKNKVSVLSNYVGLVDKTEYFIGTSTLKFSVVIPDFYDEKDKITPKFSYNGEKNYTFKHLLNILDRRPDSSVIIMSYRNYANGDDGTIEISKNEIQTADRGAYDTKIIIAQETGDVSPPYITFFKTSKKYLLWEIGKINIAFNSYSNFGGIAIHYANAFLAME